MFTVITIITFIRKESWAAVLQEEPSPVGGAEGHQGSGIETELDGKTWSRGIKGSLLL